MKAAALTLYDRVMLRRQGVRIELGNNKTPLQVLVRRSYANGKKARAPKSQRAGTSP
jgi:hypothetical protein